MSFSTESSTPPHAGPPQQPSFVGDFQFDRPTHTLSALVYSLYILALLFLAKWVELVVMTSTSSLLGAFIGRSSGEGFGFTAGMVVVGLGITLIPVLVARGIGHGSHDMWLLLLVLALLALVLSIPSLMHLNLIWAYAEGFAKAEALFTLAMPVVVLVLSFTPAVRHHCAK